MSTNATIPAQLPSGAIRGARPDVTNHGGAISLAPRDFGEVWNLAHLLSDTDFVPKAMRSKPGDVLAALMMGAEVGLSAIGALRGICIINGRPSLYGDAILAVCMRHPDWQPHKEWMEGTGEKAVACITVQRVGYEPTTTRYSVDDAKKAGLWNKAGPWTTNPPRMLQMRARAFGLRDRYADALAGLASAEESMDMPDAGGPMFDVVAESTAAPAPEGKRAPAIPQRRAQAAAPTPPVDVAHDATTGEVAPQSAENGGYGPIDPAPAKSSKAGPAPTPVTTARAGILELFSALGRDACENHLAAWGDNDARAGHPLTLAAIQSCQYADRLDAVLVALRGLAAAGGA